MIVKLHWKCCFYFSVFHVILLILQMFQLLDNSMPHYSNKTCIFSIFMCFVWFQYMLHQRQTIIYRIRVQTCCNFSSCILCMHTYNYCCIGAFVIYSMQYSTSELICDASCTWSTRTWLHFTRVSKVAIVVRRWGNLWRILNFMIRTGVCLITFSY